ncbi:unnamed protein product [Sympodiomycopsis kandeliae]
MSVLLASRLRSAVDATIANTEPLGRAPQEEAAWLVDEVYPHLPCPPRASFIDERLPEDQNIKDAVIKLSKVHHFNWEDVIPIQISSRKHENTTYYTLATAPRGIAEEDDSLTKRIDVLRDDDTKTFLKDVSVDPAERTRLEDWYRTPASFADSGLQEGTRYMPTSSDGTPSAPRPSTPSIEASQCLLKSVEALWSQHFFPAAVRAELWGVVMLEGAGKPHVLSKAGQWGGSVVPTKVTITPTQTRLEEPFGHTSVAIFALYPVLPDAVTQGMDLLGKLFRPCGILLQFDEERVDNRRSELIRAAAENVFGPSAIRYCNVVVKITVDEGLESDPPKARSGVYTADSHTIENAAATALGTKIDLGGGFCERESDDITPFRNLPGLLFYSSHPRRGILWDERREPLPPGRGAMLGNTTAKYFFNAMLVRPRSQQEAESLDEAVSRPTHSRNKRQRSS